MLNLRSLRACLPLILGLFGATWVAAAEPYRVGDTFESFAATDAKGVAFTFVPGQVDHLIVSYAMSPGKTVNTYLATKPADYLETHRAVFLANIYGMPGVGRFFALPKMKKYAHRIVLADSETLLTRHPVKDDFITVFSFDATGKITGLRQLDPEKQIDQLLAPATPAALPGR